MLEQAFCLSRKSQSFGSDLLPAFIAIHEQLLTARPQALELLPQLTGRGDIWDLELHTNIYSGNDVALGAPDLRSSPNLVLLGDFYIEIDKRAASAFWGNILNAANRLLVITNYWWVWVPVGLLICLFVLCVNFIGEGIRDATDVSQRG